ncbi:MAG: pyrimidine/purine nucleotide monophosphate nucleosidase domain-containing protein, partial [Gammaproteobacteria bacterium]
NWLLRIPPAFQQPFEVSHASMSGLKLAMDMPVHERAANLRRAFSGIVAGNVKEHGIRLIEERGPFEIHADREIARPLDELLRAFVAERRMKLVGEYRPSYRIV